MTSADFAVRACDSQFLLGPLPRLTQRLALKRTSAAGKALGAVSLGAAFVLGSGEAFAGPKTMMHDGESFFNVGDLNSKQLQTGAMEITFDNGETIVIPTGEYGFHEGDLYISENHLPYELAHAVLPPEQVKGYVFSKSSTADGLSPIPTSTPVPTGIGYALSSQPTYIQTFITAGTIVLAGAALWFVLTQVGDAPEFEYPIYTISVEEDLTDVIFQATAKDLDSSSVVYSLRDDNGVYDNEFFQIDPDTGELTWITPGNFEAPADDDFNNVYDVKIDATDNDGGIGSMLLHVTVKDDGAAITSLSNVTADPGGTSVGDDYQLTGAGRVLDVTTVGGMDYVEVSASATLTAAATISTGDDNDLVVVNQTASNPGTATINLGDGNDRAQINTQQGGNWDINLGSGADTVIINTTELTDTPTIFLYTSDDQLDVSAFSLTDLDTANYGSFALAQDSVTTGNADIAFGNDGSNTQIYFDTDNDNTIDVTVQLNSVTDFDTGTLIL